MSHWLDQICSRFSPSDSLLLAVVCDVTGASPDGVRGILFLNREVAATNIINDKRRELIIRDAKNLLLQKRLWTDITYPLGEILSRKNGECRVIYQFLEESSHEHWIRDARAQLRNGNTIWLAFRKGAAANNSNVSILQASGYAALTRQFKTGSNIDTEYADLSATDQKPLRSHIVGTNSEQFLLLPVETPLDPVIVIGRHRAAIEVIRLLALLPLRVSWFADDFSDSDPSGPLIKRQHTDDLSMESLTAGSVIAIMSNDHLQDLQLCEMALLQANTAFVGCIGSSRKAALFKEQLMANGLHQHQLEKLHIPLGLPEITGKHPSLIAASVMAQILTVYHPDCYDQLTFFDC